jgi:hypothetical protein
VKPTTVMWGPLLFFSLRQHVDLMRHQDNLFEPGRLRNLISISNKLSILLNDREFDD